MKEWDQYFLKLAQVVSEKSKDPSTKVGAVLVDQDRRVISTGYNGFAKGFKDNYANISREYKLRYTIHAENNALLFAKQNVDGCTSYQTHPPCGHCLAQLKQSGITEIVFPLISDVDFRERWGIEDVLDMAYRLGIVVREIEIKEN